MVLSDEQTNVNDWISNSFITNIPIIWHHEQVVGQSTSRATVWRSAITTVWWYNILYQTGYLLFDQICKKNYTYIGSIMSGSKDRCEEIRSDTNSFIWCFFIPSTYVLLSAGDSCVMFILTGFPNSPEVNIFSYITRSNIICIMCVEIR